MELEVLQVEYDKLHQKYTSAIQFPPPSTQPSWPLLLFSHIAAFSIGYVLGTM